MSDCVDGDIRLSGGSTPLEGRVEVCFNKLWGTVCHSVYNYDRYWGSEEGQVVCTALGHQPIGRHITCTCMCMCAYHIFSWFGLVVWFCYGWLFGWLVSWSVGRLDDSLAYYMYMHIYMYV